MAGSPITESDSFPTTLSAPNAGESASAPTLLSEFLQGAANRTRWLFNRIAPLVSGGSLTPATALTIFPVAGGFSAAVPTGHIVDLNAGGITVEAAADGGLVSMGGADGLAVTGPASFSGASTPGNIVAAGYVRGRKRVAIGSAAAGDTTYLMANLDHVYLEASAATGSTGWKIDLTGANSLEMMRFSYTNSGGAVTIKNPDGTTLATLSFNSGFNYAVTVLNNAGTLVVVDRSYHP